MLTSPIFIARAQNGDPRAVRELVERFQDAALAYAFALLPDRPRAERAARMALRAMRRRIEEVTDAGDFGPWLGSLIAESCAGLELEAPVETVVPAGEDAAGLLARVASLPRPDERAVLLLLHWAALNEEQIAALLDLPTSTVHNRLVSATRRLKKRTVRQLAGALASERPSGGAEFVERVLSAVRSE